MRLGLAASPVLVHLLGGDLTIEVDERPRQRGRAAAVFMTGPAEEVFTCELSPTICCAGWAGRCLTED